MDLQKITTIALLASLMFGAGLQINRDHLMAALKDYRLIARALLANFIIIPIIGVLIVRLLNLQGYVAIGVILMTIAPGVPFVVKSAGRKQGGSLGFAAALAVLMPALSIITIPLTSQLVFPADVQLQLPALKLIITLVVFQLIPLLIGLMVADRAPTLAARLQRPAVLLFFLAVIVLLVLLGPTLARAVESVYGSRGIWAMLLMVMLSALTGWLFGGAEREYRRTLSIVTVLRNFGTCAVIATASFPHTLATPTVLTYFLVAFTSSLVIGGFFRQTTTAAAT